MTARPNEIPAAFDLTVEDDARVEDSFWANDIFYAFNDATGTFEPQTGADAPPDPAVAVLTPEGQVLILEDP